MKRTIVPLTLLVVTALAVPVIRADVKTVEKSTTKLAGMLGAVASMAGAPKEISTTVALHGNRMARINDVTGEIVDLSEEKVYQLNMKKKEYQVATFAELRAQMEEARKKAAEQAAKMKPEDKQQAQQAAQELEVEAAVKETGQKKTISGYDTREVILTIMMHEKGKKIEDGGMIMTNDMWIAPKVAALDDLTDFQVRYAKAVYSGLFGAGDAQQMAAMSAMLPGLAAASEKMQAEAKKMQGTQIAATMTVDTVKSPAQMKEAADQQQQQQSGGGLSGALARRMMGNRGNTSNEPRTTFMTTTREYTSIQPAATADDVAIPAGFKLKK